MAQGANVDFGTTLREAREKRGVSLREISNSTRISFPALEALERNDFSRLPGGIFSRAFVRAYAEAVGLDPEETVRDFVAAFPSAGRARTETSPRPAAQDHVDIGSGSGAVRAVARALTVLVPVALVVGYVAWSGRLASWRSPVPAGAPAAAPVDAPRPAAKSEQEAVKKADQPMAVPAERPLEDPAGGQAPVPSPPPQGSAPPPAAAVLPDGTLRFTLTARGRCWVSLRSDGVHVFAGTMEAGATRDVEARGRISLTVGDAGVFSYAINGAPARPIGGMGQVITVIITTENYRTFLLVP